MKRSDFCRRVLALLLAAALLGGLLPHAHGVEFSDVPESAWYYDAVQYVCKEGLFQGVGRGRFEPDTYMSRAMLVTVLWRMAGSPAAEGAPFADVAPDAWYAQAAAWAAGEGIVTGVGHRRFAPEEEVTRAQVAVLLYRSSGAAAPEQGTLDVFSDRADISAWAVEAMRWAVAEGILTGVSAGGSVCLYPQQSATRAQVAAILMRRAKGGEQTMQALAYGLSGSGQYPLMAYRIGTGENVMLLTFALHGWEDVFDADGAALVTLADELIGFLQPRAQEVTAAGWSVYIVRCANPDGLYLGKSCNGPGRCTTTHYTSDGRLVAGGVDINRSFPYCYRRFFSTRSYNGTAPLQCAEARALKRLVEHIGGSGRNVCIDTHGWYGQIIPSEKDGALHRAFRQEFPSASYAALKGAPGYFSAWAAFEMGWESCLFELPSDVTSYEGFLQSDAPACFLRVIWSILTQ